MSNPTPTPLDGAQAAQDALVGTICHDLDTVTNAVATLVSQGAASVYGALSGWASVAAEFMIGKEEGMHWYIEVVNEKTGQQVNIDDTGLPPAYRDAFRMITAFKNDDHDMIMALFKPYWEKESDDLLHLIKAMLELAATAARHHMDTRHGEQN